MDATEKARIVTANATRYLDTQSNKHNLAKCQMSLLLQYTRPSSSRVQFKESASLVLFLLKLLVSFPKFSLSWQLSNSQIQDHISCNMIGGIFQLKALLFNSTLNQRHQSCRNHFPEVSHYSPSSIIQNTRYSKGYIRQIHNNSYKNYH